MRISLLRSVPILLLAALCGACANDKSEQQQELAQMRIEIEQLTNALGRLEFRVYELENQLAVDAVPGGPVTAPAAGLPDSNALTPGAEQTPEQSDKRFDLAPVE